MCEIIDQCVMFVEATDGRFQAIWVH